jgi:hypothetical protein
MNLLRLFKIFYGFSGKAHEEVLEKNRFWNGKVRSELRRVLKCLHALPRDSFFFCLKVRTST